MLIDGHEECGMEWAFDTATHSVLYWLHREARSVVDMMWLGSGDDLYLGMQQQRHSKKRSA